MLAALFGTIGKLVGEELPAFRQHLSWQMQQVSDEAYRRTLLTSLANQAAAYCEETAARAGYEASVQVFLELDGSLDHVRLVLAGNGMLSQEELRAMLARQLDTPVENIWLEGS